VRRWASCHRQLLCPAWLARLLDNPWVDTISGTQTALDRIGVQPGERGLDVGSGPGGTLSIIEILLDPHYQSRGTVTLAPVHEGDKI